MKNWIKLGKLIYYKENPISISRKFRGFPVGMVRFQGHLDRLESHLVTPAGDDLG